MQKQAGAGYFIEILVVVAILGSLFAIALPNIGQLFSKGRMESYDTELRNIQTAVTEMLSNSESGLLIPVGPVSDMNQVQTFDTPPLVLTDYLYGLDGGMVRSGCAYTFAADNSVTQMRP